LSNQQAGDLSTLFDIGGIFGGILAGVISDLTGMSAVTCAGSYILTIPMVILFANRPVFVHLFIIPCDCSFSSTDRMAPLALE
jgi:sugar phosphate permease